MALNLAFESLKTAGNAETNEIRCLSVFHRNLPRRHHRGPARLSQSLPRWAGPRLAKKQKIRLLCNFFAITDSLQFPKSENRPFHGRFTAFSSRYPRFGAPKQSIIAKKLQSRPIFCFRAPKEASNQRHKRDRRAMLRGDTMGRDRGGCYGEVRTAISVATKKQSHGLGNHEAHF